MKNYYHYFKASNGNIYKCSSILKFDEWAEQNNIEDWVIIQRIFKQAIEVVV